MDRKKKRKFKKICLILISSLLGLSLVLLFVGYLVFNNYINKINLVDDETDSIYDDNLIYDEDEDYGNYQVVGDLIHKDKIDTHVEAYNVKINPNDSYVSKDNHIRYGSDALGGDNAIGVAHRQSDDNNIETIKEIKKLEEKIAKNFNNNKKIMEDNYVINLLLIGSDSLSEEDRGRSDSMMLVSVNKRDETVIVTSLLRDIYLKVPGKGNNRLNTAYPYGGAKLLMQTIRDNFKIKVDRYIKVDFNAFVDIIDAIGGVIMDVTEEEVEYINRYISSINISRNIDENTDCLSQAGVNLLNGRQALGYARLRKVGTDFGRSERQRKIINYIYNELKGLSFLEYNDILNTVLPLVTTNLKEKEIFSYLLSLPSYLEYDFVHWSVPVNDSYKNLRIRGMSVLGIDFDKNIEELQHRIYDK